MSHAIRLYLLIAGLAAVTPALARDLASLDFTLSRASFHAAVSDTGPDAAGKPTRVMTVACTGGACPTGGVYSEVVMDEPVGLARLGDALVATYANGSGYRIAVYVVGGQGLAKALDVTTRETPNLAVIGRALVVTVTTRSEGCKSRLRQERWIQNGARFDLDPSSARCSAGQVRQTY